MTASVRIAVVAHQDRRAAAVRLVDEVGALGANFDDGTLGCEGNHRTVWNWHAGCGDCHDWAVVLEDDAQPVAGFREQLAAALAAAPAPIVSLYLGTDGRTAWQNRIRQALKDADPGVSWLRGTTLLHAVAVAIRTDILPMTLTAGLPPDAAISNWAKQQGHLVAYTLPSLVNHADLPPVITQRGDSQPRNHPRRAHHTGTRERWTNRTAALI